MGFKPQNRPHHERLLARGEVVPVTIERPQVWRHIASSDTYGEDADGRFVTGYLPLQLGRVPRYQARRTGLQRFGDSVEEAARTIVRLLASPWLVVTARHAGVDIGPARLIAEALSEEEDERKALRLIDLYGPRDIRAWARAILELGAQP